MSKYSYPQAFSYVCKLCGKLTASRSRWHVDNQVCADGDCADKRDLPDAAEEPAENDERAE